LILHSLLFPGLGFTLVEHLTHKPEIKGSNAATGTMKDKLGKIKLHLLMPFNQTTKNLGFGLTRALTVKLLQ
jgi:hypothetical protein